MDQTCWKSPCPRSFPHVFIYRVQPDRSSFPHMMYCIQQCHVFHILCTTVSCIACSVYNRVVSSVYCVQRYHASQVLRTTASCLSCNVYSRITFSVCVQPQPCCVFTVQRTNMSCLALCILCCISGKTAIIRNCLPTHEKTECASTEVLGVKAKGCICSTDLCNGASLRSVATVSVLALVAFAVVVASWF